MRGPRTGGEVTGDGHLPARRGRRRRGRRGAVHEAVATGLGARHQVGRVILQPGPVARVLCGRQAGSEEVMATDVM